MAHRFTIVGIGEALFDLFPDKQVLGGATLNAAVHAHQLAAPLGGRGLVVSRVGQDELGRQLAGELAGRGMTTEFLQTDPDRATGTVYVGVDERGEPSFDIVRNVAWDVIQFDPDLEDVARRCEAVCFGTLAQRDGQGRNTLYRFLDAAPRALRLFDVNLRQDFYDQRVLRRSCESAAVVKLNRRELPIVAGELGLAAEGDSADVQAGALLRKYKLRMVALTRGAEGTVLYTPAGKVEGPPVSYPRAADADNVGAGDACTAGLLVGLVLRLPLEKVVNLANHCGAYVASQPGAVPRLPQGIVELCR